MKEAASEECKTAGAPAKILLTADQSSITNNFNDVVFVTATIVDANGILCPNEDTKIKFSIEGNGIIDAVDNGNTSSHDIYKASAYAAFHGKCLAIIKTKSSSGKVILKADGNGLTSNTISIDVKWIQ